MKRLTASLRLLVVTAFAAFSLCTNAAEPTPAPAGRPPKTLIDLDFAGGTIAQLVTAVAKADGAAFNLIGETADMATTLPPFSLHNVDSGGLANALSTMLNPRGLGINMPGFMQQGASPIFVLVSSRQRPGEPAQVHGFQLASALETHSVDDIVDAIRTAWQLDPAHDPAALKIKFHPATKLLFVSGPSAAIGLAAEVYDGLKQPPKSAAPSAQK